MRSLWRRSKQILKQHFVTFLSPGTFVAGEMLDWEAPTGGYLLTASLASGVVAAEGALAWWEEHAHAL